MIYLLLALLIGLFLIAFISSGEDILAPSVIVCIMWIFSTICAIYNIDKWGIELHVNTIAAILVGLMSFMVGGFIGKNLPNFTFGKKRKILNSSLSNAGSLSTIPVSKIFFLMFLFAGIVTVVWQFKWVISQVGSIGVWSDMMTAYRSGNSTYSTESISKPSILSNLETLLEVNAYVSAYIGINNLFAARKAKRHTLYLFIPGLLFAVDKILNAGRGGVLFFVGAIMLCAYIMMQKNYSWKKKISRKYIKYMIIALAAITLLFSISRSWVGRTNQDDFLDYITTYAGGSIQLFDMFMQNPEPASSIFGKETFHTLINFLGRIFGISEWCYIAHLEFRISNGVNLGNVYGAFRYYLYDFGWIGMVILSMFAGVFYTFMYKRIKHNNDFESNGFSWRILVYMYFAPSLFMFSIADYTYALLGNIMALFKWFVLAWIYKKLVIDQKISLKGARNLHVFTIEKSDGRIRG